MSGFHDVRMPEALSDQARGGPHWETSLVALGAGHEQRNQTLSAARRHWDLALTSLTAMEMQSLLDFYLARQGALYGFRFRDPFDYSSAAIGVRPGPEDQRLGRGDGETTEFQLTKAYGGVDGLQKRPITRPLAGSVQIAIDGERQESGWQIDLSTGRVTLSTAPPAQAYLTAGFHFDCPARFVPGPLSLQRDAVEVGRVTNLGVTEILEGPR